MASKSFELQEVGTVHVYKRKGTKSLRLSIASDGKVRVTVPAWASYASALEFATSRTLWIQNNLPAKTGILHHGHHIGKAHKLIFETSEENTVRTRIAGSEVRVSRPQGTAATSEDVQSAAHKAAIRALRLEAQKLLPVRLKQLALKYGFQYSNVRVKQLKGRWGSCDTHANITLNLFLMQLPWHLIDYVLVHELTHTKHLNHSPEFWAEFLRHEPRAKQYRTMIRKHKPILELAAI
jgi:predicted metal-dependent hydrolase